ncbi:SRPBCC family protein [Actinokineospora sp. 24-640]
MRLEHHFRVPAPVATVWAAVLDPEKVAPCMPGATLTAVDGDTFTGTVKVKLGPISLVYKGKGEFLSRDPDTRRVVIKASGKDSHGNGTAAATVTLTLTPDGDATTGTVETDLAITGKPAQFGRGLIAEVGGKLLNTFATCLSDKLSPSAPDPEPHQEAAEPEQKTTEPKIAEAEQGTEEIPARVPTPESELRERPTLAAVPNAEGEAIDLMELAGRSVVKRAIPTLAVLAAVSAVVAVVMRKRR